MNEKIQPLKMISDSRIQFSIFGLIITVGLLLSEFLTDRLNLYDFYVMYSAAKAYLNSEIVYGVPFGLKTGYYKYSPFTLLSFVGPSLLQFKNAAIIHFLLIGCCSVGSILMIENLIREYLPVVRKRNFALFLSIYLIAFVHLFRDLHLGNINIIIVLLLVVAIYKTLDSRDLLSGFLLAFVIMAKPYFIITCLPLLIFNRFRMLISTGIWILIFISITILFMGLSYSIELHKEWLGAMIEHNNYLSSSHTIFSLLNTYFGVEVPQQFTLPIFLLANIFLCYYFHQVYDIKLSFEAKPLSDSNKQGFILHFCISMAMIPSFLITDTEHFLFSLPLLVLMIMNLELKINSKLIMAAIIILMYGGNSSDIIGLELSREVNRLGLLGISNILLLGLTFISYHQRRFGVKRRSTESIN